MKPRMEEATLVILLLSGLSTLSAYFSREYHYVNLKMSWTEAQTYCRERFTDLATIDNDNDNQRLLTLAKNRHKSDGFIWIGLYDDINSWKWSMEDKEFHVDRAADFTTWLQGQPNNKDANQYCVVYDKKMQLNDLHCDNSLPFICYDANSTTSYVLVKKKYTWSEAQTYCREHHRDLASIRNKVENDNIQLTFKASIIVKAWIGLYREPWAFWSDNSTSTFTNWGTGQPNTHNDQFCGGFFANSGKWTNGECEWTTSFFCFKEVPKQTIWKIKIWSVADMNSKEIQQQVLQQLQARMMSKQLRIFKIQWRNVQSYGENHKKKADGEVNCTDTL